MVHHNEPSGPSTNELEIGNEDHRHQEPAQEPVKATLVDQPVASIPPVVEPPLPPVRDPAHRWRTEGIRTDSPAESEDPVLAELVVKRSLLFRGFDLFAGSAQWLFGFTSLVIGLAFLSTIPIVQFLVFGYLLEASGRVARSGRLRDGLFGMRKAAQVGGLVVGTWLWLLPVRYCSYLWSMSHLIDDGSVATGGLRAVQLTLTVFVVAHILAAWYCGGKLRYFFWPLVAPFSLMLWISGRLANSATFKPVLERTLGRISPHLVQDLCRSKPLVDWFLPAILVKGLASGRMYATARDAVWDFFVSLRLPYYLSLGVRGFLASLVWLALPTLLLIGGSLLPEGLAILSLLLGIGSMSLVILYLPFLQTQFAATGQWKAMFQWMRVRRVFRRAPMMFFLAFLLMLVLSLPLFVFKIEQFAAEILWLPGVLFIAMILPARLMAGWAYGLGDRRDAPRIWVLRWLARVGQLPVAFVFSIFVFITRYTSWNGVWSLLEDHTFLVPAPFLQLPF